MKKLFLGCFTLFGIVACSAPLDENKSSPSNNLPEECLQFKEAFSKVALKINPRADISKTWEKMEKEIRRGLVKDKQDTILACKEETFRMGMMYGTLKAK